MTVVILRTKLEWSERLLPSEDYDMSLDEDHEVADKRKFREVFSICSFYMGSTRKIWRESIPCICSGLEMRCFSVCITSQMREKTPYIRNPYPDSEYPEVRKG